MFIVNTSNYITLILLTIFTGLIVYLGRETKKSILPGGLLIIYLIMLVVHAIQLIINNGVDLEIQKILSNCMVVDFILVFISYLGYLWVDEISSKANNKKSVSNDLDWLWKKV